MIFRIGIILSLATGLLAGDCRNGAFRDECVSYFSDNNCATYAGSYIPTCEGNCFKASFKGLQLKGNTLLGTACQGFYDDNCELPMEKTKGYTGSSDCLDYSPGTGGNSMKCWFDC